MADVLDYQIFGDDLQLLEVELDPSEGVRAEVGTMTYMEDVTLGSVSRTLIDEVEVLWLLQGVSPSRQGPFRQRGLGRKPTTNWRLDVHGFDIGTSHAYERRDIRERQNRYRLFPIQKLALADNEASVRVGVEPASILRAVGLGTGPAGAGKSVGIVMGASVGRPTVCRSCPPSRGAG